MGAAGMFAPLGNEARAGAPPPKGNASDKTPIVPVPADAPPMQFKMPKFGGAPTRSWPYHDGEGRLVGYVGRWDIVDPDGQGRKEILPITFCDIGGGKTGWRSKGIPSPRPLFALPDIKRRAEAPILICEGEKTRDAAATLFPDMVATTPPHGAKSPHLADFACCAGRTVVIATDHDDKEPDAHGRVPCPGREFGDKVFELVREAGAAEVLHLDPARFASFVPASDGTRAPRPEPMKDGWDLADALEEGWTAEAMAAYRSETALLSSYEPAPPSPEEEAGADEDRGWPFRVGDYGVEKLVERVDRESGVTTREWRWFCSLLEVAAETRSSEGEEWGRLLVVTDRDDRTKQWAMPMSMLAGDGTSYRERLLSLGMTMAPGKFARDALHEYISTARPDTKARCVGRVGWHARSFALPDITVDPSS